MIYLKQYRNRAGMSQGVLAEAAGVSTAHISNVERETCAPSIRTLERLARALGIETEEMFKAPPKPTARIKDGERQKTLDSQDKT